MVILIAEESLVYRFFGLNFQAQFLGAFHKLLFEIKELHFFNKGLAKVGLGTLIFEGVLLQINTIELFLIFEKLTDVPKIVKVGGKL
jgi:hypothetical protein